MSHIRHVCNEYFENKVKQADVYNKKVMRNIRSDYLRKLNIRRKYKIDNYETVEQIFEKQGREGIYLSEHILTDTHGHIGNIINEQLYFAIQRVPDRQREVLILEFWYGIGQTKIAKQFGVSEKAIYNWKQKAFKSIQKFFERRCKGET